MPCLIVQCSHAFKRQLQQDEKFFKNGAYCLGMLIKVSDRSESIQARTCKTSLMCCAACMGRVSVSDGYRLHRTLLSKSISHKRSQSIRFTSRNWHRCTSSCLPWWSPVQVLTESQWAVALVASAGTDRPLEQFVQRRNFRGNTGMVPSFLRMVRSSTSDVRKQNSLLFQAA